MVVEGSGSRIETRASGIETRFGPTTCASPRDGSACSTRSARAPGISPTSPSSGTVNTVSAFGSGVNENVFLIDGTNFTCPCAGVSRAEPSVDVIQEVHVQSIGGSVEFGNIQGAVINVVTQAGRRPVPVDGSYYGQPVGLTASRSSFRSRRDAPSSGYERARYRDFTANLGGPVSATGSGSTARTSTCVTTTASRARTRRFRESTSRTRSLAS